MGMHKKIKAVILGLTNSGKSSVAEVLRTDGWPILEVDDVAQEKNGGIWPESEDVLEKLFKETNEEVTGMDNVVFVTSFLEPEDLKRFVDQGFKIIELHASYDELLRRKIQRDGEPKDKLERFNRNYNNFQIIKDQVKDTLSLSLDTTGKSVHEVVVVVEMELEK